jgi:hypothetical protein
MGFMKAVKQTLLRDDAARAVEEGRRVFVARFWDEVLSTQMTGSVGGAAEAIEEVESLGWQLADMSYAWVPEKKRGVTVMVFRPRAGIVR